MPLQGSLQLAPHVRACLIDGQMIMLDLKVGRYLGLGAKQFALLADAIAGWPVDGTASHPHVDVRQMAALASRLLSQGLLIHHQSEGPASTAIGEACRSLNARDAASTDVVGVRRVWNFMQSSVMAAWLLRRYSLLAIVETITRRRSSTEGHHRPATAEHLIAAVAAYESLRPLVFTARDKCLHDSLALVNFLAREKLFPRLVVGVKTRPFAAHAWVQCDDLVLNDQHEFVRRFTPILVV